MKSKSQAASTLDPNDAMKVMNFFGANNRDNLDMRKRESAFIEMAKIKNLFEMIEHDGPVFAETKDKESLLRATGKSPSTSV